jgi:hypothetical protein
MRPKLLTEFLGVPVAPATKRALSVRAAAEGCKPASLVRKWIEQNLGRGGRERPGR